MLKGLFIRQAFVLIDLVLAAAVAGVTYLAIGAVFESGGAQTIGAAPVSPKSPDNLFPRPRARAEYDSIIRTAMFGKAAQGNKKADEPAPPPPAKQTEEPTKLQLRLLGTVAASPTDPLGNAVIENGVTKTTDIYYIGQPVMEKVILIEVHKRKVILLNQMQNTREVLSIPDDAVASAPTAAGSPGPPPPSEPGQISLKKAEVAADLQQNAAAWLTQLNPEMYRDASGKVGITSKNLGSIPLAKKAGLQDGDVITSVNGVAIDSEQRIAEVFNKFKDLNVHRIEVLRNGVTKMITCKLE